MDWKEVKRYLILTAVCVVLITAAYLYTSRDANMFNSQTGYSYATYLVKVTDVVDVSSTDDAYAGTFSNSSTDVTFEGVIILGEKKGEK